LVFSCQYHSIVVLHSYISSGGWEIFPLVVAVQRRSLTPSKMYKNPKSLMVIICPSCFNNLYNDVFCVYGFCMLLTVNSDYFLKQY
jgi:hypothetical protein